MPQLRKHVFLRRDLRQRADYYANFIVPTKQNTLVIAEQVRALGVTRVSLSRVLNGKAGVSAEMAVRLGKWLGTGPEVWINMQAQYELWKAERALKARVRKIPTLKQVA